MSNGSENIWKSIEKMPYYNWFKILETGDLKYIFKKGKGRVGKVAISTWYNLQDQYFTEFGKPDELDNKLRIMQKIIKLNNKLIQTGDYSILNLINVEKEKLVENEDLKSIGFYEEKDILEKYKGFRIDPKKTTVIEWGYTLKNMIRDGRSKR